MGKHLLAAKWTENLLFIRIQSVAALSMLLCQTQLLQNPPGTLALLSVRNTAAPWPLLMEKGVSGWEGRALRCVHRMLSFRAVGAVHRLLQDLPRARLAISQSKGFNVIFTHALSLSPVCAGDSRG